VDPCVLVTRGHFWSRDKDGSHTIRSAITENPATRKLRVYSLQNRRYYRSKFYVATFHLFAPVTLTFIYELDPYSLDIYRMSKYELSIRQDFRMLSSDRQTDTTDII